MDQKKLYEALYKFTTTDFKDKPFLSGILHKDGYMIASNAYTLAKVHYEAYNFDYEELIINKKGEEVKAVYSNIDHLLREAIFQLPDELIPDVIRACKNLPKGTNKPGECVCLNVNGFILHTYQLAMCIDLFELMGESPKMFAFLPDRPILMASENCQTLCMCHYPALKAKDLLFTIEEALNFDTLL